MNTFKITATLASAAILLGSLAFAAGQGHMSKMAKTHSGTVPPKVQKILQANCIGCHNDKRHPQDVDLSSYASIMKGAKEGPIVVPGKPAQSPIVQYIDGSKQPRMPFRKKPLSSAEIKVVSAWVKSGAK